MTKYTYSIQNDFPAHKVASDRLTSEIQASSIAVALDHIDTSGDACDVWFKAALSGGEETTLNGLVTAHSGEVLPDNVVKHVKLFSNGSEIPTPGGKLAMVGYPAEGAKTTYVTQNFCDETTWLEKSTYVADETAADSGDHLTYNLAHAKVIDTAHGKVAYEDILLDAQGHSYAVAVKVNGSTKTARAYRATSGGDYHVDYHAGKIIFYQALDPADVVTVTYHYAGSATWTLKPDAGKLLKIVRVKAMFTDDIKITDTVKFQVYVAGNPYGYPNTYKNMYNYLMETDNVLPPMPVMADITAPVYTLKWEYIAVLAIRSSYAMEVRVSLSEDKVFGGTFGVAAFECLSEAE